MLNVSGTTRVLVATSPVDLRGSFNRLYSLVVEQLKADPLSGHLFVFTNGRRNRIKVLYWDGSGLIGVRTGATNIFVLNDGRLHPLLGQGPGDQFAGGSAIAFNQS